MLFFRTTRIPLLLLRSSRLLFPSLTPRCCCYCCCLLLLPRRRRRERIERALMSSIQRAFYLTVFCSPRSKNVHYFFSLGFILSVQFRVYFFVRERFLGGRHFRYKKARSLLFSSYHRKTRALLTLLRCYHQHHHVVDSADARKIVVFFSG